MGKKSCTKISNYPTRFSCENFAVEDFVTLFMVETLVDRRIFCLSMASTKLYQLYALLCGGDTIIKFEMGTYFFLQVGEICKSRHSCSSTVPVPVKDRHQQRMYVDLLPSSMSVNEHKYRPAKMRYSYNLYNNNRQTPHRCSCGLLTAKIPQL